MTPKPEARPLAGFGVAVTREEPTGGPLARRLARRGARVVAWRAVEIAPPRSVRRLARAAAALAEFDWVVLTSARAVEALVGALGSPPCDSPPVAAVGRATALAATRAGFRVRTVPARHGATGLVAELAATGSFAGKRVLWPASAAARPELAAGLASIGAQVERVEAYRTRPAALDAARCRAQIARGEVDVVTFTSPSAVESLARTFGAAALARDLAGRWIVSIGPTTSEALVAAALPPHREARPSSLAGLVAATIAAIAPGRRPPGGAAPE